MLLLLLVHLDHDGGDDLRRVARGRRGPPAQLPVEVDGRAHCPLLRTRVAAVPADAFGAPDIVVVVLQQQTRSVIYFRPLVSSHFLYSSAVAQWRATVWPSSSPLLTTARLSTPLLGSVCPKGKVSPS